jgi:hypothetical protein
MRVALCISRITEVTIRYTYLCYGILGARILIAEHNESLIEVQSVH